MAFKITLQKNKSETNAVNKELTDIVTVEGTLKTETSIIDPVIVIECDIDDVTRCNYAYIPKFDRYYFVRNITSVRNGLVEFVMHVDVLMSFRKGLLGNRAIVKKQENDWNLYLNDGTFKTYQNPMVTTKEFPSGFNAMEFVMAIAGS